jgi:hypothetical protein
MNEEPLMDVAVQAILFLELSDERTVNEDAAVEMMEQIATTLRRLEPAEKERFRQYLKLRAARASTDDERETIEGLAENLGLTVE